MTDAPDRQTDTDDHSSHQLPSSLYLAPEMLRGRQRPRKPQIAVKTSQHRAPRNQLRFTPQASSHPCFYRQTPQQSGRKKTNKQTDRQTDRQTESKTKKEELDSSSIDSLNVLTGGAPIDLPLTFLRHA